MAANKRVKTRYPGVYYIKAPKLSGSGDEKIFRIMFRKEGKLIEESLGRQSQGMTAARANMVRIDRLAGKTPTKKEKREAMRQEQERWTINKLWDSYCEQSRGKSLDKDKQRFNTHIRDTIGNKEPSQLAPLDIDRMRIRLLKTRKPCTVRNILELIRRTINYARKRRLCTVPDWPIEMPRFDNQVTECLTDEQLSQLHKVLDNYHDQTIASIYRLALYTGMRRGEILKLKWDDIDLKQAFVHIRDPKSGKNKSLPLNDLAIDVIVELPDTSEYLFPGRDPNEPLKEIKRHSDAIRKAVGLPTSFRMMHGLRHTYASKLASSGQVDLYVLQTLLTHSSPQMTQRYAHLRDEALKKAAHTAGDVMAPKPDNVVKLKDKAND